MNYKNKVARVIFYTGVVFSFIIFASGLFIGIEFKDIIHIEGLSFIVMIAIWIGGFVTSLLFFGGAEIIELLDKQNMKSIQSEPVKRIEYQHTKYEDL
jgi:hypothetical protein